MPIQLLDHGSCSETVNRVRNTFILRLMISVMGLFTLMDLGASFSSRKALKFGSFLRTGCLARRFMYLSSATHFLSNTLEATDSLRSSARLAMTATVASLLLAGGGGTITPSARWSCTRRECRSSTSE